MMWDTEVGNPSKMISKSHNTEASARHRLLVAVGELQEFGRKFNAPLETNCRTVTSQIKDTNFKVIPMNEWRGWSVRDDYSGVTLVTRIRRTM